MTFSSRWTRLLTAVAATAALGAAGQVVHAAPGADAGPSRLSLVAEPQAGVAPFLKMIDGARTSIDPTTYELFDQRVEQALVAAEPRGVDVRVLLNGGYYSQWERLRAAAGARWLRSPLR